jgi:4-amino-4-deoxy-L-arabinose transferase-like glycosyltransferase
MRVWRFSAAPDIFGGDETLYNEVAFNLSKYGKMAVGVWSVQPKSWFIHPPLFFLIQSAFFWLAGITQETIQNIYLARLPTSLWASLAVLVVFVWITKATDLKFGAATALLVMLEPYFLKYGRIGILESLVLLLVVTSLYFFWRADGSGKLADRVLAGVFFGLALLTKELAFYLLFVLVVWVVFARYFTKTKIRKLALSISIAIVMYLSYALWALAVSAQTFISDSTYLLVRILWIATPTGYTNPQYVPFATDFLQTASIYIATYVLLAMALVASSYLILREKGRTSVLLSSWFIGSAAFFTLIGVHNPQFFVYVTVPAAVVDGYALSKLHLGSPSLPKPNWKHAKLASYLIGIFLIILIAYNSNVWYTYYGVGTDNAYLQSVQWAQTNIPQGSKILASYSYRYFLTGYTVFVASSLGEIKGQGIHYIIVWPRALYRYTPELQNYIMTNGKLIETIPGVSLREVDFYYIQNPI